MNGQSADVERNPPRASPKGVGLLPPRHVLQTLFSSVDRKLPADRLLLVIAIATCVLATIALGAVLYAARPIMLPLAAAFVLSILLAPAADWLGRLGLPEGLRAGVVVIGAVGLLAVGAYFIGRPGANLVDNLPAIAAEARDKLEGLLEAAAQVRAATERVQEIAAGPDATTTPEPVVVREEAFSNSVARSAQAAVIQLLFTAVLLYFLLATRTSFRLKAMAARPTLRGKLQTARILRDMQRKVGRYMFTMLIINTALGAVVAAALMAIGLPSALVWGFLAGLLNFVPYLGPTIVTALLAVAGLVHYDTLLMAAAPPAIYAASNFIESNVVTPSFVGVRLKISPLAIIVSIALLTWIWGPVGAVLAIPLVVVFKTICDDVPFLRPLGVLIGEVAIVKDRKYGFFRVRTA